MELRWLNKDLRIEMESGSILKNTKTLQSKDKSGCWIDIPTEFSYEEI
jgi:hypothetical protein